MVRVYAIASAKGGVGKTTTTANLGATLADTGADVVVIDGDIGMANLGAALGVHPHGSTLHDALSGDVEPVAAAYDGPSGLTVVPGDTSLEAFSAADPQRLQAVVDAFDDADFVLIDVGAGVSHETSLPLSVADAVVLVSTPERDALVDTEKTRQLTDRLGGAVAGAVLTRTDEATPVEEIISGTLPADVLTTVPEDEAVRESIAVGEPLVSYAPHSEAAAAYRRLVTQLTGLEPSPPEPAPTESPVSEPSTDTDEPADPDSRTEASDHRAVDADDHQTDEVDSDRQADTDHSPEPGSDSGVTIDAGADTPDDTVDQTPTAATDDSADRADSADPADSDADHNVVNPFAATPEDDGDPQPAGAESKWAEAATGTGSDESTDAISIDAGAGRQPVDAGSDGIEIRPEADVDELDHSPTDDAESDGIEIQPEPDDVTTRDDSDTADESVPRDAIPFGSRSDDEGTVQRTVLGAAIDEGDGADNETAADDADAPTEDDEPLIPDAEGSTAVDAGTDADRVDEADDRADEDEDKEEKRGFFSRLFG